MAGDYFNGGVTANLVNQAAAATALTVKTGGATNTTTTVHTVTAGKVCHIVAFALSYSCNSTGATDAEFIIDGTTVSKLAINPLASATGSASISVPLPPNFDIQVTAGKTIQVKTGSTAGTANLTICYYEVTA